MRVFLTGGTGFIGRPLTHNLVAKGWEVVAAVRRPDSPPAQALARLGARLVPGDVTERESLRAGMAGADIVIHNAGYYELGLDAAGRARMHAVNVQGTEHTFGLAHELGVPRTVYVSSIMAFGDTGYELRDESFTRQASYSSYYEQTKAEAHQLALGYRQRGLALINVMPSGVIGPNDHSIFGYFLRLYINRIMPPTAFGGDSRHSFVYVEDLARAIGLVAEHGRLGEDYLLCGDAITIREHFSYWADRPGGFRSSLWLPADLMALSFWPLERLQRLVGLPAFLSRETAISSKLSLNYSSAKAQRELGWSYRGARQMWLDAIDGELALLAQRKQRDLVARLRPLDETAHV
jgi:dihydroflavonol-4-reductase